MWKGLKIGDEQGFLESISERAKKEREELSAFSFLSVLCLYIFPQVYD